MKDIGDLARIRKDSFEYVCYETVSIISLPTSQSIPANKLGITESCQVDATCTVSPWSHLLGFAYHVAQESYPKCSPSTTISWTG